jgi:hypothetical protein
LCEFAVTVVEDELMTNRTIDMAERGLQMFCSYFPAETVARKCEEFVDTYGDELIRLLVTEELSPREICAEMDLCHNNPNRFGK